MTNSYINPTQPNTGEPRYSQDAPAWQDVRSSTCPPWRTGTGRGRSRADPHHRRAGTGGGHGRRRGHRIHARPPTVNMGVDTNQSDFTREQAEQLVGDIQEQLYETAKSQKRLHDLIAQAFTGRAWIALGYPAGLIGWNQLCQDRFTADAVRMTVQQRTNLILSFQDDPISNRSLAAALGVSEGTVRKAVKKAKGAAAKPKPVVGADGKRTACRSSRRRNASNSTRRSMT